MCRMRRRDGVLRIVVCHVLETRVPRMRRSEKGRWERIAMRSSGVERTWCVDGVVILLGMREGKEMEWEEMRSMMFVELNPQPWMCLYAREPAW